MKRSPLRSNLAEADKYWPGSDYVDWIGADGYGRQDNNWRSFESLFAPVTKWVAANHPDKPIMAAETGVSEKPGDPNLKADWYQDAFQYLKSNPSYGAWIYFDVDQMNDTNGGERAGNFSFDSSKASRDSFLDIVNDPYFT